MRSSSFGFFVFVVPVGFVFVVVVVECVVGAVDTVVAVVALGCGATESMATGVGFVATVGSVFPDCVVAEGKGSGNAPCRRSRPLSRNPKNAPTPMSPITTTAPATMLTSLPLELPFEELVWPSGTVEVSDASIVDPIAAVAFIDPD